MKKVTSLNQVEFGQYIVSANNFNEHYLMDAESEIEAKQEFIHIFFSHFLLEGKKTDLAVRRYDSPLKLPIILCVEIK